MFDFIAPFWEMIQGNPVLAILVGVAALFLWRTPSGDRALPALVSKAKTLVSSPKVPGVPAADCCTVEGRLASAAYLVQHCRRIGRLDAVEMITGAIPALMEELVQEA